MNFDEINIRLSRVEKPIWDVFMRAHLPFHFNDLDTDTPETLFFSILDQYSDFEVEVYDMAARHDPSVGQDYWREVELVEKVRGERIYPRHDDPLLNMFQTLNQTFCKKESTSWKFVVTATRVISAMAKWWAENC